MVASVAMSGLVSCNDEFLDLTPKAEVVETNAFLTYETCTAYLQNLYSIFEENSYIMGPALFKSSDGIGTSVRDIYSGLLNNYTSTSAAMNRPVNNGYAAQTVSLATSANSYTMPYRYLRRVHILINHLQDPVCTEEQRLYLEGVARFFRAFYHFTLMQNYGDVIYIGKYVEDDSEELYAERDSRLYVSQKIYEDLKWCIDNMPDSEAEPNTINTDVVRAFLSRFALFEGTWRKYHKVDEAECAANGWLTGTQLLEICANNDMLAFIRKYNGNLFHGTAYAGDKYPGKGWGQLWTMPDLGPVQQNGVLLYMKYIPQVKMHRMGHREHIADAGLDMPQCTVDLYLTKDGLPIHNPGVKYYDYQNGEYVDGAAYDYANCDMYKTFRNRDPRMWQMIMPPYYVTQNGNNYKRPAADSPYGEFLKCFPERGDANGEWLYCRNYNTDGYLFSDERHKTLPSTNWAGVVLWMVPNVKQSTTAVPANPANYTGVGMNSGGGFQRNSTGYFVWKHHAHWDSQDSSNPRDVAHKPIFMIEETMLNYAEASFELGRFNQSVADETINKLRERAEVGIMNVSGIGSGFDPDRDQSVDPVLWEIRRERLIELMGDGFSFEDVRRWKKADWFVNKQHCGIYVENANKALGSLYAGMQTGILKKGGTTEATAAELAAQGNAGHLFAWFDPVTTGGGWKEKYYLYPIPTDEILLNPNLKQQPAWLE